jgi:selT/selW/selH-like putative selenoprotein
LEAELQKSKPGLAIELVEGDRGIFEVRADGRLVFSKKEAGRFPNPGEVLARLDQ